MYNYGVVRTDNMLGTDARSALVSVRYYDTVEGEPAFAAIENGCVLKIGDLEDGQREVYVGGAVAANDDLGKVVLVASPELLYDERLHDLDDYINVAGKICRGYHIHTGDTFSVTKPVLAGAETPAVGDVVELAAGTKLNVVAAATGATEGSTVVGRIIAIDVVGKYTYYAIKVD